MINPPRKGLLGEDDMNVIIDGITYVPAPEQPKPPSITRAEVKRLTEVVENAGLDYAMNKYSSFDHGKNLIRCRLFHQLRDNYLTSRVELQNFLISVGVDA